eukprot:10342546-Alexandrium_andersonii.AAC.1
MAGPTSGEARAGGQRGRAATAEQNGGSGARGPQPAASSLPKFPGRGSASGGSSPPGKEAPPATRASP